MHRSTWKVSFGEIDYAGIVYYPNFFDYFQRTLVPVSFPRVEEEFMEQVGFPYQRLLGEMGIGFPIVGVEASFKRSPSSELSPPMPIKNTEEVAQR